MDPRPIHIEDVKYRPTNRTYLSYNLYDSMTFKQQPNIHVTTRKQINVQNNIDLPKQYYFGTKRPYRRQNNKQQIMRYQSMQLVPTKKSTKQELYANQNIVSPENRNNQISPLDKQQSVASKNSVFSRGGKNTLNNYSYAQQIVFEHQQRPQDIINWSERNRMTRLRNFPKLTLEDKYYQFEYKKSPRSPKGQQGNKN